MKEERRKEGKGRWEEEEEERRKKGNGRAAGGDYGRKEDTKNR